MREPAVRKTLYWCERCNIPLLGRRCACGAEGKAIPLLRPYDARPALAADNSIITGLLEQHFGIESLPRVVVLNKTAGRDRNDLIIANGDRFGWLSFDPASGKYSLELEFGAVSWLMPLATRGVIDLAMIPGAYRDVMQGKRIGGKKYPVPFDLPEGPVLMTWDGHAAVGTCRAGSVKVKGAGRYIPAEYPGPGLGPGDIIERSHFEEPRTVCDTVHQAPCRGCILCNSLFLRGKGQHRCDGASPSGWI